MVRPITKSLHTSDYNHDALINGSCPMSTHTLFRPLTREEAHSIATHPLGLELYAEILKVQAVLASQITPKPQSTPVPPALPS